MGCDADKGAVNIQHVYVSRQHIMNILYVERL